MQEKIIEFIRKRDYTLVKELGQGACGKTVLLYDDMINEYFVCKKYVPYSETQRQELFANFIREIKLLHQVHHRNVVRVFNYYLYPENLTGYILMEFVDGSDIDEYIEKNPEKINEIFLQTISGFQYLENNHILHRDIRPGNILVCNDGSVKIIDLGFGKQIHNTKDFEKSISLNWWCSLPEEFNSSVYDFRTEVYFVGKLFEKIIKEKGISHFKYSAILNCMCRFESSNRVQNFFSVKKDILNNRFYEIDFTEQEMACYQEFARRIRKHLSRIETNTKYYNDINWIENQLENVYRTFLLEETIPNVNTLIGCFINGSFFFKKEGFPVYIVKNFIHLLKSSTQEKKRIIMSNLHTNLDAVPRYAEEDDLNEIPF